MKHTLRAVTTLVLVLGTGLFLTAQTVVQPKQLDYSSVGILYNKEKSVDIRPHTNGIALGVHFGTIKTYYKTTYYQFDLGYVRHPKEYKQSITFSSGYPFARTTSSYTYGKQNQLILLRGGVGVKRYYSDKAKRKGVAVGIDYEFGPSIGLLKPYYLRLSRLKENGFIDYISVERYSEENKEIFLDETKILGPGGFFKGFGQMSIIPGVHARLAAHFSLGTFDQYIKAVELGVMVDGFFKRVPIMVIDNNTPMFINGYISFQFGKRQ